MTAEAKATAKKTATTRTHAAGKRAVKPVVKPADREPVKTTPESAKKPKKPKIKMVRNFSMPQVEYQKIAEIKEACLKAGLQVKKSEVLRAGLKALGEMNGAQLKRAMAGLEKVKAGHPKKP